MRCCLGAAHVAAYGQGQSAYARLQPWITACHPRGTFRGTVFWLISAQRVPSVRSSVLSVQLARMLHEAILLVNGRSAVRSRSPAPRSDGVKLSACLGSWNERHQPDRARIQARTMTSRAKPLWSGQPLSRPMLM